MSTKTTFKRVALVAVAALGLGLLSVAPSQATTIANKVTPSATVPDPAAHTTAAVFGAVIEPTGFAAAVDESIVAEAVSANDKNVPVNVAVAVSPVRIAAVVAEIESVSACGTACDGATERTPRPNAATAISATRLIVVDICFLSIVDPRTIRRSA